MQTGLSLFISSLAGVKYLDLIKLNLLMGKLVNNS